MKNIFLWRNRSLIKNHSLLDNPLILPQIQILISFWSQKTEKQKFDIKENVMSELVKMPNRHFLRRDYLHIFFYIKFLLFVSLVHQISLKSVYLIATRDLRISGCNFFYLKIKGLCDFLRKRF